MKIVLAGNDLLASAERITFKEAVVESAEASEKQI